MRSVLKIGLLSMLLVGSVAYAGDGSCSYNAYISKQDLSNSNGKKLTTVGQVLRQDRANFHNGNGDSADEDDYCGLDDANVRSRFEKMVDRSTIPAKVKRAIMGGYADVTISTYGNKAEVSLLVQ